MIPSPDSIILYEEGDFIVCNKPSGILCQATEKETSLKETMEDHLGQSLFLVHRIDRPASGLILYAKHKKSAAHLSALIQDTSRSQKFYLAAVEKQWNHTQNILEHNLFHDTRKKKSYVCTNASRPGCKKAITKVNKVSLLDNYSILDIKIETGRFHQIRCQLSSVGHPIKGDVKYGARRKNKDRSIHLHSWKLELQVNENERYMFHAPLPEEPIWNAYQSIIDKK